MFPLRCVHVPTSHEMSAHKKTWSTRKCSGFQKLFAHNSYTSFQIQMSLCKILHKIFFYAQTDFEKLEETLIVTQRWVTRILQKYSYHNHLTQNVKSLQVMQTHL